MNILYVTQSSMPGGMEWHIVDLIKGMTSKGHKVFVWAPDEGLMYAEYAISGAEVFDRKAKLDIDPLYIIALTKFLREHTIDVIHAHELKAVVNALIAASLTGTKARISHTHTPISEWQVSSIKKNINLIVYPFIVNLLSTREIALTESRKRIKIKEGISENKLVIIPNALDIDKFTISEDAKANYRSEIFNRYNIPHEAFIFGNIGRLTEEKGINVLVDAFDKFLKSTNVSNTRLLLAGGGKLEESIRLVLDKLGIAEKVTVTGRFPESDKVKYYAALDCFIHPSLAEGFGIVLMEAMASKLTVLCSDLEVFDEVGGSTVMYFETGNADDLAEKMLNIYNKRSVLQGLQDAAYARVRELFSMDKFVDSYEGLYYESLNAR